MKAILTGASGFIGGGVLEECLDHPDIASIVVLCRSPLSGPAASSTKVKVLIVEDFLNYSKPVLDELKDADFCIWSLGHRYNPSENVEVGYTIAFCEAMARLRSEAPTVAKPFRMVYLSGKLAITDQSAPLWWNDAPRKAKGMAETKLLAFSDSQKQNRDPEWDTYVVRPGGVLMKQWGWITGIFGGWLFIQIDVLARAMVATALHGDPEKRLFHEALVKKGEAEFSKGK